jgi:hypothetical protein
MLAACLLFYFFLLFSTFLIYMYAYNSSSLSADLRLEYV